MSADWWVKKKAAQADQTGKKEQGFVCMSAQSALHQKHGPSYSSPPLAQPIPQQPLRPSELVTVYEPDLARRNTRVN
jgi:hypothetical protein